MIRVKVMFAKWHSRISLSSWSLQKTKQNWKNTVPTLSPGNIQNWNQTLRQSLSAPKIERLWEDGKTNDLLYPSKAFRNLPSTTCRKFPLDSELFYWKKWDWGRHLAFTLSWVHMQEPALMHEKHCRCL